MTPQFNEMALLAMLPMQPSAHDFMVDVGAHVGTSSKPFAAAGWNVLAFEPEPSNFKELCRNMVALPSVTCLRKAVSDAPGENIPFYVSDRHWGIHALKPFHETHRPSITVEAVRLDAVLDTLSVASVAILKVDTEGADFSALRSLDWKRHRPTIAVCEFMDHRSSGLYGYTHHDMAAFMQHLGYAVYVAEWAAFDEYGQKGHASAHRFIRCAPYPLQGDPFWGNLLFVAEGFRPVFESVLESYLGTVDTGSRRDA